MLDSRRDRRYRLVAHRSIGSGEGAQPSLTCALHPAGPGPRITQRANPTNVVLLLGEAGLEGRPLLGHQYVIEGTVGHRYRRVRAGHPGHVLGFALVVLL